MAAVWTLKADFDKTILCRGGPVGEAGDAHLGVAVGAEGQASAFELLEDLAGGLHRYSQTVSCVTFLIPVKYSNS